MKKKLILPIALMVLGLAVAIPCEKSLRSFRNNIAAGSEGEGWVRYVMVCLGGFRGVISEVLWVRAAELQEQGRYFELVQLADWITALDPRASEAWAFNAWNLSYNITAMLPDEHARINWLQAGIDLLQKKALRANPSSPRLYRELGWLYQNKIGDDGDRAHIAYKLNLASKYPDGRPTDDMESAKEIEAFFGKLDWRLAESHAVYWAWTGLKHAKTQGFEREALRRMIRQNVFTLITAGRFTGDIVNNQFKTEPAYDLTAGLMAFCEETLQEDSKDARIYEMTLARLVQILHLGGRDDLAQKAYSRFCELLTDSNTPAPLFEDVVNGAGQTGL